MKKVVSLLALFAVVSFAGCAKKKGEEKPKVKKEHHVKKDHMKKNKHGKNDHMKKHKKCKPCDKSMKHKKTY
jgi:hypothetical protein